MKPVEMVRKDTIRMQRLDPVAVRLSRLMTIARQTATNVWLGLERSDRFVIICCSRIVDTGGRSSPFGTLLTEIIEGLTNGPEISTEGQCLAISHTTLKGGTN